MKQHSYSSVNREMKIKSLRLDDTLSQIKETVGNAKKRERSNSIKSKAIIVQLDDIVADLNMDLQNGNTRWPENVTFMNFIDFLAIPTLVIFINSRCTNWNILEPAEFALYIFSKR